MNDSLTDELTCMTRISLTKMLADDDQKDSENRKLIERHFWLKKIVLISKFSKGQKLNEIFRIKFLILNSLIES